MRRLSIIERIRRRRKSGRTYAQVCGEFMISLHTAIVVCEGTIKRHRYSDADWSKGNDEIARKLGVSRQAVSQARRKWA